MSSNVASSPSVIWNDQPGANVRGDDIAISVRNVGKMYYIYGRPQDRLRQAFLWGKKQLYKEFWALRGASFDVKKGEVFGVVGRNGSGKSTLLQIVAGTLAPTTGEVYINGHVAALLELGSGFNPEYTGRENVYMNAAILGLSRAETEARFDRIVDFADIGDFIERPVKVYSTGMMMRLAFAVAANISSDILILDEILAVGDEAFQRKCLRAVEEFQDRGGSVLLVSHDIQAIVRQCQRAALLDSGHLLLVGSSKRVGDIYQQLLYASEHQRHKLVATLQKKARPQDQKVAKSLNDIEKTEISTEATEGFDQSLRQPIEKSYGIGGAEIYGCVMLDAVGREVNVLVAGRRYRWRYKVKFFEDAEFVQFGMMLKTKDGIDVAGISSMREGVVIPKIEAGMVIEASFDINLNVSPATYFLNVGVNANVNGEAAYLQRRIDVAAVRVIPPDHRDVYGLSYLKPAFSFREVADD
jgi:lipopolysaccharide transport system ATP-binding protein